MNAFCLVLGLGMLGVGAWALLTGQVGAQGLDGIFLLMVCLFMGFVFLLIPLRTLRTLRRGSLRELLKRRQKDAAPLTQKPPETV